MQDLLWRYHVAKEHKQERVNDGGLQPSDAALKRRQQRMVMGITGTLIPAVTPRQTRPNEAETTCGGVSATTTGGDRHQLRSSSSQRPLARSPTTWLPPDRDCSSQLSLTRSPSRARSRTGSVLSTSSSLSSIGSLRLQEMIASQVQDTASGQIDSARRALEKETRKREAADRKIQLLCEKLGLTDDAVQ